jgi:hypothetical protein
MSTRKARGTTGSAPGEIVTRYRVLFRDAPSSRTLVSRLNDRCAQADDGHAAPISNRRRRVANRCNVNGL